MMNRKREREIDLDGASGSDLTDFKLSLLDLVPEKKVLLIDPVPEKVLMIDARSSVADQGRLYVDPRSSLIDIDNPLENDHIFVPEFVLDVYSHLRIKERDRIANVKFLHHRHPMLTCRMRSVAIDWIVDVCNKYHLLNDSLHLTVALFDRYLAKSNNLVSTQIQLVAVTALWVACKMEEIYPSILNDFNHVSGYTYKVDEFVECERDMLKRLDYNITYPTSIHFARRFSKAAFFEERSHSLVKYLLEVTVPEYEAIFFLPSMVAASAVYLTLVMLPPNSLVQDNHLGLWTVTLQHYTGYTVDDLGPCVSLMADWTRAAPLNPLNAAYRKYSTRFFGVAKIQVPTRLF